MPRSLSPMWLVNVFRGFFKLFSKKKHIKLGLYGPPNGGKTTLANRICADWLGEEMGSTSKIAHETRKLYQKDRVTIKDEEGRTITFTLVDTPGLASTIDYEDFMKEGLSETDAKQRAREASDGVLESVKWIDNADCVVMVVDATKEPGSQVNELLVNSLIERETPLMIIANKVDLKKADVSRVQTVFPDQDVLGISAKHGDNVEEFYTRLFELTSRVS